jgi:hypothetical protein
MTIVSKPPTTTKSQFSSTLLIPIHTTILFYAYTLLWYLFSSCMGILSLPAWEKGSSKSEESIV